VVEGATARTRAIPNADALLETALSVAKELMAEGTKDSDTAPKDTPIFYSLLPYMDV